MPGQLDKESLARSLNELESLMNKAQIVQGGNSEKKTWAGSNYEEQNSRNTAPNGTDYEPENDIAHKALLDSMSDEELENYYAMRKSGLPNPAMAEREIYQRIPGVEKKICKACLGTQYQLNKSTGQFQDCPVCEGYGFRWRVPDDNGVAMVKAIAAKYNLNKAKQHPHGVAEDGGEEGADTTPADSTTGGPEQEEENNKNFPPNPSSPRKKVEKAQKKMKKMLGDEDVDEDEDVPVSKDKEREGEELAELLGGEDEEKACGSKKAKKSLSPTERELAKSYLALTKAHAEMAEQNELLAKAVEELYESQGQQADLLSSLSKSFLEVSKGLLSDGGSKSDMNKSMGGRREPARPPKTSQVQWIEKSFVDNVPGTENQEQFSGEEINKALEEMVAAKEITDVRAMRVFSGEELDEGLAKSVHAWITKKQR